MPFVYCISKPERKLKSMSLYSVSKKVEFIKELIGFLLNSVYQKLVKLDDFKLNYFKVKGRRFRDAAYTAVTITQLLRVVQTLKINLTHQDGLFVRTDEVA